MGYDIFCRQFLGDAVLARIDIAAQARTLDRRAVLCRLRPARDQLYGTGADFTTLDGVMALFDSRGGAMIGWIHYLAFDLFVGIWTARNADRRGIHRLVQGPILFFIFMLGPLGLTLYLVTRQFLGQRTENAVVPS